MGIPYDSGLFKLRAKGEAKPAYIIKMEAANNKSGEYSKNIYFAFHVDDIAEIETTIRIK